ncbi:hypothetical protein L209DRAFT_772199 [Thermothelomyces heterothallicus CBS 203.75]
MGLLLWNTASNAPYPGAPSSSGGPSNWDRRRAISSSTQQQQHPTRTHPSATRPSHFAETSSPPGPGAGRRYVPTEERDDCHHRKVRRIRSAASATPHRDRSNNGPPGGPLCLIIPHQEEDRRSRSRGPSARGALVSSSLFTTTSPAGQGGTPRRRPPSLGRQGAFRDERTAKRRRRWAPSGEDDDDDDDDDDDEHRQDAERCRIRLLLDDERELDKGFAPDRIVREGLGYYCYYCCSLSARRPRGRERRGEDEALAGWLLSGSSSSSSSFSTSRSRRADAVREEVPPWRDETSYDGQQLTVIHELADDLSDDVLLSGVSSVAGQEDDRTVWAVLDDRNHVDAAAFQAVGAMMVGMDESRRSSGYAGP